ncbi:DNA cytosine methyltransferase [Paenibacillus sp. FSL R5-0407]|uniref:DNA cytosine methyltransferase n=1 Tax=Paenibacillus sp. FSL R5-0407 TaxID=2975320 RepID=UPI0030F96B23
MQEIIVDNFAGGGGASTGIELATGRSVDIAINHDPAAIAMHRANHPETEHYCESVWDVDPKAAAAGRPIGLAWFSPDCKHFSKAKGGKPVEKKIRGLAWIVLKWAGKVRPRVIILENVEEFKTWGPVRKGRPVKSKKGQTFEHWKAQLESLGYKVESRELRACDYGAPTIRKRFFLIARRDGRPIVWPEPTHGDPESDEVKTGKLKPWRTAAEIIDWSIPCPSIFERKKPLAMNTERRIARGIQRFILDNPNPFITPYIIKVNHKYDQFRGQSIEEPMQTITATNGWGLVTPYIARIGQTGFGGDRMQYEATDPLTTVTTKAEHLLVTPILGVNTSGHPGSSPDEPLRTITTGNHHMVVSPTLIEIGYGEGPGQAPRAPGLQKPLGTVVSGGRKHAVVAAFLARHFGQSVGSAADEPIGTVTAGGGGHSALVTAHITKFRGGATGHPVYEPLHTITSGAGSARPAGAAHALGLVTSHLIKMRGTNIGHAADEPVHTITAGGLHIGEVRAFLLKYYGSADNGQQLDEPLHTVTTKDRFGLVTVEGVDYQIVDIGMRMLEPHELFAAQGFPDNYIIDVDADGVRYPKSAQVARCGNAVPPPFAAALVRSNLPELCTGSGQQLTLERYKPMAVGQVEFSL